ncbi:MAG: family 10 glycosylhydrolase, partial [Myxococcaceae bacterium]
GKDGGTLVRRITALEITPKSLELNVGAISGVTAVATFDDGSQADVTGSVQWVAQPSDVLQVEVFSAEDNLARVETLKEGVAQIVARTGNIQSDGCTVTVKTAPTGTDGGTQLEEIRAVWVTRFAYSTAAHVTSIINRAADAGFNTVYFQIRGNGDAYYKSNLVPWAQKLTGTLGRDPGWDPLQLAIDTAHARGIQLHAYWNVFSAWPTPSGCGGAGTCACTPTQSQSDSCTLPPASPSGMPTHVLRTHPEWMAVTQAGKNVDSEYYWFSPGNPAVRQHLVAVADELLTKYDVDGLHLDRVRYPGSTYSHDAASVAAYEAIPQAQRPSWQDWQRQQVNGTVEALYNVVKQRRPKAVLSASVWGIYKALPGCSTSQGYSGYYQDSIAWMKNGQIDAIVPMIYWDIGSGCTDWAKLLDGFLAGSNGRHVVAGMHALENDKAPQMDRIRARVEYARTVGAAGHSIFASTYLEPKSSGSPTWTEQWSKFPAAGGPYTQDAGLPEMTWR